jgi:hypothetical protein
MIMAFCRVVLVLASVLLFGNCESPSLVFVPCVVVSC